MALTGGVASKIPWGEGSDQEVGIPPAWSAVERIEPDLRGHFGLSEYRQALEAALDQPGPRDQLSDHLRPGRRIAIVVDDPSRWTPVAEALPVLLERLEAAGVRPADISINVGVGRHHAVDAAAMERRVGATIARTYACHSPPVDDLSRYDDLGVTPEGVPVRVFQPVARADLRILIGSVLPHLQAGFGGGYKLIFPGCSHRSTLGALHRQGLSGQDAGTLLGGDPEANAMRRAIRHAAALLRGPCLSISHLLGPPGQILRVAAGVPDEVQAVLSAEARQRFEAPVRPPVDVVVAGNHPWPGDPMQSFKVLLHHRAAARPSGALVGFFWTDLAEIDRSFPLPAMRAIAATGAPGGWFLRRGLALADRAAAAAGSHASFMIRWARELVVDRAVLVYAPALRERVGPRLGPVQLFDRTDALWDAVRRVPGMPSEPSIRLFPSGGLTYAPVRSGLPNQGSG